jgi:heat shock protein HtpX
MNNLKVFGLMAALTALAAAIGGAVGGQGGLVIALLLAAGMNFFAYWTSAAMVLRMYGAAPLERAQAPELYDMVDRLRQRAGLPMPAIAIAPHAQPNAFATGRNPEHAVVCVTEGLLGLVDRDELEGVVAHELAHIKNRDMLLQTFTATLAGAVSHLGQMALWSTLLGGRDDEEEGAGGGLLMALLAPVAAGLVQMAISRQREFKADAVGAEICGRPLALAGALQKLESSARRIPMDVSPAAAPLAQVNPLAAFGGSPIARLFSTHPPTEERVTRLRRLAGHA